MLLTSIRASVSPDTINRVGRLFNNTLPDVLGELLQNARRAGATSVEISLRRGRDVILSTADNGIGIIDPASVITLGRSDWNDEIAASEDPAGMGMFSLAGQDVTITSRHASHQTAWAVHISADGWDGSRDLPLHAADRPIGTTIEIQLPPAWDDLVNRLVEAAALHYPLPVQFNGIECQRQDWIAKALYRTDWNGSTIGVFAGHTRRLNASLNFHGLTVPCKLPTICEVFGGDTFYARVDIHDSPALQLVLPARKEAVENDALRDLRIAVERALFEAIGQRSQHKLPFAAWSRARELGVVLSEADPVLYSWQPVTADSTSEFGLSQPMSAADAILVERSSPETEQCVARALKASPLRAQMVDEEEAYLGYAWYDGLARLQKFRFDVEHDGGSLTITDAMAVPLICDHLCATKITLRADLHDKGRIYPIAEDADVAFVTDDAIWSGLEAARIIYRDTITLEDLTDLLDAAHFSASDDSACDSWDTQHRAFEAEARDCAVKLLCGPDEAICDQFRCLLQNNRWLLPEGASLQISVSGDSINVALSRQQVIDACPVSISAPERTRANDPD